VRELLYKAGGHLRRGRELAAAGDYREALAAYGAALRDLHALKPQRQRDVLLAHVYLARYQLAAEKGAKGAQHDLRIGYSYARTTGEPGVRLLAESLWQQHLAGRAAQAEAGRSVSERPEASGRAPPAGRGKARGGSRRRNRT
jgi:hypothetical protein